MELNDIFAQAKCASRQVAGLSEDKINSTLLRLAAYARKRKAAIIKANDDDVALMDPSSPDVDRLRLTPQRLDDIAASIESVAQLPSPQNRVISSWTRPNGMAISKVRVPFGVIGIIYEARPNVTFDVFALCLKSGNAVIMKGGKEAVNSNEAIAAVIHEALRDEQIDEAAAMLLPASHEATRVMLEARGLVDLIIPRGGRGLIDFVRANARVPVIETGAGLCHAYFHNSGDLEKGRAIVNNAKTRRVSVCNALDCLIIDRSRLADLAALVEPLAQSRVVIYADAEAYGALHGAYPFLEKAAPECWDTEWRDYKMAVKTVAGIDEALRHIARHGSGHSESIIAQDTAACRRFQHEVDAACVYANLPTSFTDGGQFGFGAEIGISTQKLHARGPMGLPELNTYKYVITGDGQIREK